jgi:hypothetical protein
MAFETEFYETKWMGEFYPKNGHGGGERRKTGTPLRHVIRRLRQF